MSLKRSCVTTSALACLLGVLAVRTAAVTDENQARPFLWKGWLLLDEGDANVSLAFSPDTRLVAVTDGKGSVRTWRIDNGEEAARFDGNQVGIPLALAYSIDGKRLLLAGHAGVTAWDTRSGQVLQSFGWPGGAAETAAFSGDGAAVALGGSDGTLKVIAVDGKATVECRAAMSTVLTVAFSPDGKLLASGSIDGTIRLWDLPGGEERVVLHSGARALVAGVAFSPDGTLLASVGGRDGVTLWDIASGTVRVRFGARPQGYRSIAFAPDGKSVVAGSAHGAIDVWDLADPQRHAVCRAHIGLARDVRFGDATLVGSAGSDGVVRLWEGGRRVARGEPLSPEVLQALTQDLMLPSEAAAARAVLRLAGSPTEAIANLRAALRPARAPEPDVVARHIAALDSDTFAVRAAAGRALERLGPVVRLDIAKAIHAAPSLETRRRLELLLARLEEQARAQDRQLLALRSILILERIATPDAVGLLRELTTGLGDATIQREAELALARLR